MIPNVKSIESIQIFKKKQSGLFTIVLKYKLSASKCLYKFDHICSTLVQISKKRFHIIQILTINPIMT